VDVSHWQHDAGPLNWSQVAASGQKFAVMKATEVYVSGGRLAVFIDPYLHSDLIAAHAAGLTVGAYTFAHPAYSAVFQADAFASAIGVLPPGSLPPVLDLEDQDSGLTPAQMVAWTHTFLNRLQARTNIVPMIYAGPSFWSTYMGGSTEFTGYPLWEAHYTTAAAPRAMGGWATYSLWQFTSSARVPGITGDVDQDRVNTQTVTSLASLAQVVYPATLTAPATLAPGQYLESANRQYRLAMQTDGNLVEYGNGRALWSTRTSHNNGASLRMQSDGNLVLYSASGQALWWSGTSGYGSGGQFNVGNGGALGLKFGSQWLWSNGAPGSDRLTSGATLIGGQYLHTPAGTGLLTMQTDGNLVLYRYGKARWFSATDRYPGSRLILQSDGNLVIYDGAGVPRWSSRTAGSGANRLDLQTDGNLVLYSPTRAVWSTHTNG
jgi:lysozyme